MRNQEDIDEIDDTRDTKENSRWLWIIPVILLPVFFFLGWESYAYLNGTVNTGQTQYGVGGAPPTESYTGSVGTSSGETPSDMNTTTMPEPTTMPVDTIPAY